jgi:deoxyribodipyrimidine photolyase-related protein
MASSEKTLRLILGDQLNAAHSWFRQPDARVTYVIMEIRQETDCVKHHIQKVAAFSPPCAPLPTISGGRATA